MLAHERRIKMSKTIAAQNNALINSNKKKTEYETNKIKLLELFGGIGAPRRALSNIGYNIKSIDYVEIIPYAVMAYNSIFDNNLKPQDIMLWNMNCDVLVHGSPCFTGDTLVLTKEYGYISFKDLKLGMHVLTKNGGYYPITDFFNNGEKEIYELNVMGSDTIRTTGNHKFWVREKKLVYDGKTTKRLFKEPEWLEAKDLTKEHFVGRPINQNAIFPEWTGVKCTGGKNVYLKKNLPIEDDSFWYIIGRFVGDGWVRRRKSRANNLSGIVICTNKKDKKFKTLIPSYLNYTMVEDITTNKYQFSNKELAAFCLQFGEGALNKHLPGFVFDLPVLSLKMFLDGYFDSDGCIVDTSKDIKGGALVYKSTTISRELAYGIAYIIEKTYGKIASIYKYERPKKHVIEGRIVNQKNTYQVTFRPFANRSEAFIEDGILWCPVREMKNTHEFETVYDITVDEVHNFTANGIIAHNCQDWSKNGRNNVNSGRSILYERTLQILDPSRGELTALPKLVIWENVPQLVYRFREHFDHYLETMESYGYTNSWAILKASDYGIPQARERVFVVSVLGNIPFVFPPKEPLTKTVSDYLEKNVNPADYALTPKEMSIVIQSPNGKPAVLEATKLGYKEFEDGDVINFERPGSTTRRGRVGKGVAKTFTTSSRQAVYTGGNIRLFTAKEQLRLMGYSDKDYNNMKKNGITDKQICHLAGNSICVPVLEKIFKAASYQGFIDPIV